MLVSNFQMAKFYPQLPLAFSTSLSFFTCLLLLQPWNFPNIKMSCRKNSSEILVPHPLLDYLPLLPCSCVPQNMWSYDRGTAMVWKCRFCRLLPPRCVLLRRNWKWEKWGTSIHFALVPITAEGEFESFKSLSENPGLSGLAAECLSLGQPRGATARRKHPKLPYQFVFQRQRTLQLRTAAGTTLPGAQVQQPLTPFQWHLIQQRQVPSQPQGHQCNGVWLSHLCSHADLLAHEQTTT